MTINPFTPIFCITRKIRATLLNLVIQLKCLLSPVFISDTVSLYQETSLIRKFDCHQLAPGELVVFFYAKSFPLSSFNISTNLMKACVEGRAKFISLGNIKGSEIPCLSSIYLNPMPICALLAMILDSRGLLYGLHSKMTWIFSSGVRLAGNRFFCRRSWKSSRKKHHYLQPNLKKSFQHDDVACGIAIIF
jgi:hypothetical protein